MNNLSNNNNNYKILTSSLFELCSKEYTGTLFLKTDENTIAQFIIEEGKITQLAFENKRGMNALDKLRESTYTNAQFIEDYHFPLTSEAKIPCSKTILNQLGYVEPSTK